MKKLFVLILVGVLTVVTLTGCVPLENRDNNQNGNDLRTLCDFRLLGDLNDFGGNQHELYYDVTTGVIYMRTYDYRVDSYTPLFNADGTPKIWQESKEG